MAALGMHEAARKSLSDSHANYPHESDLIEGKKSITPTKFLVVGKDSEITTVSDAIKRAPSGAEILVHPGIYRESLYIDKPLTVRCTGVSDYEAIRSLDNSDEFNWAEIRAVGDFAITCHSKMNAGKAAHIVGFKIAFDAPPANNSHAAYVGNGTVVFRNCTITSSLVVLRCLLCMQLQK